MPLNGRKPLTAIKAELARRGIKLKDLAQHELVDVNPDHLSAILCGRKSLTPRLAKAISRAIEELAPQPADEGV